MSSSRLGDNMNMRGFFSNQRTQDNLPMLGTTGQAIEDKERIEVLTGATGFLYGINSPGGKVNYVTKRAPDDPLADVTLGCSYRDDCYVHGDFGGKLNQSGTVGYRLNAVLEDGETFLQDSTLNKWLLSGALDWHPLDNLKFDFDVSSYYNHQYRDAGRFQQQYGQFVRHESEQDRSLYDVRAKVVGRI